MITAQANAAGVNMVTPTSPPPQTTAPQCEAQGHVHFGGSPLAHLVVSAQCSFCKICIFEQHDICNVSEFLCLHAFNREPTHQRKWVPTGEVLRGQSVAFLWFFEQIANKLLDYFNIDAIPNQTVLRLS
jgi:hypothetical protein